MVKRTTKCGARSLALDVRSNGGEIRVQAEISPRSTGNWTAVLTHERAVAWRGPVERGRLDRTVRDYVGADMIGVRLTTADGVVCSAEVRLPA